MKKLLLIILLSLSIFACGLVKQKTNVIDFVLTDKGEIIIDPQGLLLLIPPFAVKGYIEITISALQLIIPDAQQASSVFELKPLNLDLLSPADLRIPYLVVPDLKPEDLVIYSSAKSDNPSEEWILLECDLDLDKKTCTATENRLTAYEKHMKSGPKSRPHSRVNS